MSIRKKDTLLSAMNYFLVDLPSPSNLSYFWNYGSLLGIFLFFQIITGLFLSFYFVGDLELSFFSVIHFMRDVNWGWILRVAHANGASMFFLLMYIHIGRGLYYGSYYFNKVWLSGVSILLVAMATAFLGYVLPWGQMSFWAATVITNLLSAIPYIGVMMVEWIWGGFAVSSPTLTRFFAFHFIFPFIIVFIVILHLMFLHEKGSGNSMGIFSNVDSMVFHFYYVVSDIFGLFVFMLLFIFLCLIFPYVFMDVENFILSNPLVTPTHIQPEWYFLFAYAILRSISNKIGGVVALVMSIGVLYFLPFFMGCRFRGFIFYNFLKFIFWIFIVNWMLLTWIGACEVEIPYSILGSIFSNFYFFIYLVFWLSCSFQDLFFEWF